jgi:4-carboxymuconolactone decarboxylase
MPRNDESGRNDILSRSHLSVLKETDPEFIEYFGKFAFDEVPRHGQLDAKTRYMVQLASIIACQGLGEYRLMLDAALAVGVTPVEVKELVYHGVPYVGMAKVFDFLCATNDVLRERGIELPVPGQATTTPETRVQKGLEVQRRIVGDEGVDRLYASTPHDEQHIQQHLSANCFGDHFTRTGIDVPTRELVTLAMLVSLADCEPQVRGHVAMNLNVGNGRSRLVDLLTQLLPYIGYPRTLNALRVLDEVTAS